MDEFKSLEGMTSCELTELRKRAGEILKDRSRESLKRARDSFPIGSRVEFEWVGNEMMIGVLEEKHRGSRGIVLCSDGKRRGVSFREMTRVIAEGEPWFC